MRSYARYWLETFRLPAMDKKRVAEQVHADGEHHIHEAMAAGRGTILALPHSGNWDIAGVWLAHIGYPFATVAERLKPEALFDKFVAYRESLGMKIIPLTGGDSTPVRVLTDHLTDGGMVCLLADRDLSQGGIEVDFFGERTKMPGGPARLAATTGATLLPVHLRFDGPRWANWIDPPVQLGQGNRTAKTKLGTQALADFFTGRIAKYPTDWHMLQPLWLADLDQRNRADPHEMQ
jgi:KDO2-lipid IV(A) lauroyltransferase